jgi:class 3 adenylate cyclase
MTLPYPIPANESQRNEAVTSYRIMDSPPEIAFNEIGELAAQICGCNVSYVSFIQEERFWFKAKYGLAADFTGCPRELAFCSITVCGSELVISPNLLEDPRYRDFPFVVNEPHMRFYCAMPLITPEGYALGTICVMDFVPRDLTIEQKEALRRLAQQLVSLLEHRRRIVELDEAMKALDDAHRALAKEKSQVDELLNRVLPESIAKELRENGQVEPRFYPSATILFADVVGFTSLTERTEPRMLIGMLERYFGGFDEAMLRHQVEKLKTIGDAYVAIAGIPASDPHHAVHACLAALEMLRVVNQIRAERERLRLPFFDLRVGLHTGGVIAGVVGKRRFTFDIWGDAVNTAARVESAGETRRVNVSEDVYGRTRPYFVFTERGAVDVKNKGPLKMYFLDRLKPEFSLDDAGLQMNDKLRELMHPAMQ